MRPPVERGMGCSPGLDQHDHKRASQIADPSDPAVLIMSLVNDVHLGELAVEHDAGVEVLDD